MSQKPQSKKSSGASRAEEASNALLSDLFGIETETSNDVPVASGSAPVVDEDGSFDPYVIWVDIDRLDDNPYQPRNVIFKQPLEGLIASINENGQIQAATARPHPTRAGRFQLGVGHRRKNAVKGGANAGIKLRDAHLYIGKLRIEVSAKDDEQMLNEAYAENEDREPLSVFDRATYYTMLRELESRRLRGLGLTPVSSETARKRAGAAVTADGLMSWEELVAIRKNEGKPLPGARTLRRIVGVLDIDAALRDRLAAINLADPDDKDAPFEGITEKHCSAVKLLSGQPSKQSQLVDEIAEKRLSANEAGGRARILRDGSAAIALNHNQTPTSDPTSDPKTGIGSDSQGTPAENAQSKSKEQQKGKGKGKGKSQDLVTAFLSPASYGIAEAARVWPTLRVGDDYKQRLLEQLDEVDAQSAQLRRLLTSDNFEKIKKEKP